jgi:hypothetical protein
VKRAEKHDLSCRPSQKALQIAGYHPLSPLRRAVPFAFALLPR